MHDVDKFTFHYVSIKSKNNVNKVWIKEKFTFHYVSIKSMYNFAVFYVRYLFTFHYVSIKSARRITTGGVFFWIYIPLCIY